MYVLTFLSSLLENRKANLQQLVLKIEQLFAKRMLLEVILKKNRLGNLSMNWNIRVGETGFEPAT